MVKRKPNDTEVRLTGWLCRDSAAIDNTIGLHVFFNRPEQDGGYWYDAASLRPYLARLPERLFPIVSSGDEPRQVSITIKIIE